MPASMRQATPGPSTVLQPHTAQSANSKKRTATEAGTEAGTEERDTKKPRVNGSMTMAANANGTQPSVKEKKKKKRKKKKRMSVVLQDPAVEHCERMRSGSGSVAPMNAATNMASGQRATPSAEPVASDSGMLTRGVLAEEEDEEPVLSSSDKGKGKAKSDSPSPSHPSQSTPSLGAGPSSMLTTLDSSAQASELARLKAQVAEQSALLERHQTHITSHQQSLTCQICLDLMHKPYALAPCGHTTCYDCLVRWFTAPQNPPQHANAADPYQNSTEHILNSAPARNGAFLRRRKNCPVCRAVVVDRPIELWSIKSMVAALVRSKLVDLPAPAVEDDPVVSAANNNRDNNDNDPWRNVFRRVGARNHFGFAIDGGPGNPYGPPQALGGAGVNNHNHNGVEADREQMGWFDMEDGGIYRCTDCYHEIWDGVCTACNRRYPGHHLDDDDGDDIEFDDDDDDDDDEDHDDDGYDGRFRGGFGRFLEAIMDNDAGGDLGLMEEQIEMVEEEIRLREEVLQRMRHVEQHGAPAEGWLEDGDPDAVALYHGLVAEDDEEEQEGDEEDSQYGGSFIDDEAEEEHGDGFFHDDDEQGIESDEQVEFADPPPPNNTRRQGRRAHVVVESTDDEDESEAEDDRVVARQLGRGTRLGRQPTVVSPSSHGRRFVQLSEDEEELSSLCVSDDNGPHSDGAVDNDSGLAYITEAEDADEPETYGTDEEREQRTVVDDMDDSVSPYIISEDEEAEQVMSRRTGRPVRHRVWVDSD